MTSRMLVHKSRNGSAIYQDGDPIKRSKVWEGEGW